MGIACRFRISHGWLQKSVSDWPWSRSLGTSDSFTEYTPWLPKKLPSRKMSQNMRKVSQKFRPCQLSIFFQNDDLKNHLPRYLPHHWAKKPINQSELADTICNPSLFRTSKHQIFFDCWAWRPGSVSKKSQKDLMILLLLLKCW